MPTFSRPVSSAFVGAPAVTHARRALAPRDGAIVGLALNTLVADATNLYFRYDGDFAGAYTSHILSAGIRIIW